MTSIQGWPGPGARQKSIFKDRWYPFRPAFDLNTNDVSPFWGWYTPEDCEAGSIAFEEDGQFLLPFPVSPARLQEDKAMACRRFLDLIPEEVKDAVSVYTPGGRDFLGCVQVGQWEMLRLVARCPEVLDLTHSNSSMAFCLAALEAFHPVRAPLRAIRRLIPRPQREIAAYLGFPDRKWTAKVLRKIEPRNLQIPRLLELRKAVQQDALAKMLQHVPTITAGVIQMVTDPRLLPHITPVLLEEIAGLRDEETPFRLRQVLELAIFLGVPARSFVFRSRDRIAQTQQELLAELNRRRAELPPPPKARPRRTVLFSPPIPGKGPIVPLTDPRQIAEWAERQNNCIRTLIPRVASRDLYLYKILHPQHATLSLVRKGGGRWVLGDLRGACNHSPLPETVDLVRRWFWAHRRSRT